ncbi:NAD(P)/FAD-dependent oxidoreductase [Pseudonocardiaceae bacterium YIM PH 21723]|nr:NAD(P)/FAD-dependent oxidoreductase [Pseudonocardiaceae bacterium YIM PH 21723]
MDAVIVGSGPNGLAAALVLAKAGLQVTVYEAAELPGGGTRTRELTRPGFAHDVCSATHPMALASPFFRAFDLAAHGVELLVPELSYAHPLDDGRAGLAWRDLDRAADGLGRDGAAWARLFGPLTERWTGVVDAAMGDLRHPPADLRAAVTLAARIAEQGSPLWNFRFREDTAPAMFAGLAGHAIAPMPGFLPAAAGMLLGTLAHVGGWPIPRGGSRRITEALVTELEKLGGTLITGHRVRSLHELPKATATLLNLTPKGFTELTGVPYARRFRYGAGSCKVDFALSGPVPWTNPDCALAPTLHLVGSQSEARLAERAISRGRHAARPYVLAAQPGVLDDGRAPAGQHTLWSYAHVPHGSAVDVTAQIIAQIERFAPGFRDLILDTHVITAAEQETYNPNYVGGDIGGGAMTPWQAIARPAPRGNPYRTPVPGVYLCSASTPPGGGVHGMAGVHAATRVLKEHFGTYTDPLELLRC